MRFRNVAFLLVASLVVHATLLTLGYLVPSARHGPLKVQAQGMAPRIPDHGNRAQMLIATATQPAPCTTTHGDHVLQLSLKNKLQYATLHGYAVWSSSELLSPWDLGGQWNKVALLYALMDPRSRAFKGQWVMWMDDDAIFVDTNFTFPFSAYDAMGVDLVMWGDERMTYEGGHSEGINTGTMLLRVSEWSRQLLRAWTDLACTHARAGTQVLHGPLCHC